jgi:hypothetical protein
MVLLMLAPGEEETAGVMNSRRRTHAIDTADVENSGVAEAGMVALTVMRFANKVDSECCA